MRTLLDDKFRHVVDTLYGYVYSSLALITVSFSVLLLYFNYDRAESTKIGLWSVMTAVVLFRLFDTLYWQIKLQGKKYDPEPVFFRFAFGTIATALVWSAYIILMYKMMPPSALVATVIVFGIISFGSAMSLSPNLVLAMVHLSLICVPFYSVLMLDPPEQFHTVGLIGLVTWAVLLIVAYRINKLFKRSMELKFNNIELLDIMEDERRHAEKTNQQLLEANTKLDSTNANLELEVQKRTNDIQTLSNRDSLTSLLNRKSFLQHLDEVLAQAKKLNNGFAVLFIDLDGFKQVNDSLGHRVGDGVLVEVANRLTKYGEQEHLGRWGGDEFVLVIPYATTETAIAVAQAARSGIANTFFVQNNQITLDATIGIAIYPEHGLSAQALLERADITMYEQKRMQRGSVGLFSEDILNKLQGERKIQEGLRYALSKNEMHLVYQPIVDAQTDKMTSAEALLRWTFKGDFIPPDKFIPLAEKTGIIHDIGIWVMHRACIDAMQWGFPNEVSVSVNVSVIQLMDDGFIASLDRVLKSSGLPPERLHLEITESVFADDKAKVMAQINGIKARNVGISIDDFGTGYSSLSQLQSLNFDIIKIDRSFVQALDDGSDTIIRATNFIAKEFGCKVIAEGVETETQRIQLKEMGVDLFQGYYFSKPVVSRDLLLWNEKRNAAKRLETQQNLA